MQTRVRIVGCGAVVQKIYLNALKKLEKQGELQVVSLVDPSRDRANDLLKNFPKARILSSPGEGPIDDRVDLTIIASPPGYHAEQTIAALHSGSHVLCEKPMAPNLIQCLNMVNAAHQARRSLAIGMTRRFYPALGHLRQLIDRGELGENLRFVFREGNQYGWPIMSSEGFSRVNGGGGVLMDVGPHVLDTLQWLFGPLTVKACRDDAVKTGIEANCTIELEAERARGQVQLSWDQNLVNEFRVIGTKSEVVVDPSGMSRIAFRSQQGWEQPSQEVSFPEDTRLKGDRRGVPQTYSDCIYYQLVQMLRCIRLGERPAVSGEEGAAIVAVINLCYEISRPLSMRWLPEDEMRAFEALHWRVEQ